MDLQQRLERYVEEGDVPGAVLGVFADGQAHEHAAGVVNRRTGVAVTTDSVFQIGSNTKVWTATQVMQLVDEGAVRLDAPVRTYLPDFTTADPEVAAGLTVRHLLTHTSGIEGDVFEDFGRNDDAIERYVRALSDQGSVHELDETWSYCNSGYVVAGRLVEVLRGMPWAASLRETLGDPLGLDALCLNADDAIMHRAAVGHLKPPDQEGDDLVVAPYWSLPQAIAPAGLITTTVGDLLAFARMQLEGGTAPDGSRVLSADSVAAMQTPQVECPAHELATHWGIGWMIQQIDGRTVVGHGGNTVGQSTYFVAVPDAGVAIALLTNASGVRHEVSDELVRELLAEFAGVHLLPRSRPSSAPAEGDLTRLAGRYVRLGVETSVEVDDGTLRGTMLMTGPLAKSVGLDAPIGFTLQPAAADGDVFVARIPQLSPSWIPFRFYGSDERGRASFMHSGGRAARRAT